MLKNRTLTDLDIKLLKEKYPNTYKKKIEKVENGYPIQYILGNVAFLNVEIKVNEKVLIPRFETEYFVEKILKKVDLIPKKNLKMIDICTGSGCIAVAIAKNTKFDCVGIDICKEALKIAKENAKNNNVSVEFKQLDILKESLKKEYDVVIANPPYIARNEKVDPSIEYEPSIALYAEEDGILFYKKILDKIKNKPKLVAFEIGENQSEILLELCNQKFPTGRISLEKDLCEKKRYIFIEH